MNSTPVAPPGPPSGGSDPRGKVRVLLTGTDPEDPKGGIGVAMAGYMRALEAADLGPELIPSYRPDVVGGRWWWPLRAGTRLVGEVRALRQAGVWPVVYAHGGGGIGLLRQSLLLYAVRGAGASTIVQLHSMSVDTYLRSSPGRAFLRLCLRPADLTCVLTEWWRERLRELGGDRRLAVVPNPLPAALEEEARSESAERRASTGAELRLLCMTRLVSGKGVDLAIRTTAVLPSTVSLTVAGDGRERRRYERLAHELGVSNRVRFLGWVGDDDKAEVLRSSDIFLLPTRRDSFGMGFLEAMAYGLPVVALHRGPTPQVVPHGVAGLLVDREEPAALAEAVLRMMDVGERERLGRAGRSWVLERFGADAVGRRLRTEVSELARDRPA